MDVMMLHVVQGEDGVRTGPFPTDIFRHLERVAAKHANLEAPAEAGRAVRDIGSRVPRSPG